MKKLSYIIFVILLNLSITTTVNAFEIDSFVENNSYKSFDDGLDCSGSGSLLGESDNPDDTAYYLQTALEIIRYIGIVALIGLSIVDYVKAVADSDADALKNANSKTLKRLLYTVLLFVFPTVLEFVFDLTGIYGPGVDPFCGLS